MRPSRNTLPAASTRARIAERRRFRIVNGVIGGSALVVTELGRTFYRPYVVSHGVRDFGIADTLGNSVGTIAAVFIILCLTGKNRSGDYQYIAFLSLGLCGYELLQGPMGGAIDPKDIVATVVACGFCLGLYRLLHRHAFTLKRDRGVHEEGRRC